MTFELLQRPALPIMPRLGERVSTTLTRGIRIEVLPKYHLEHSDPVRDYWFFSYTIQITNQSTDRVQLLSRHWVITDATGKTEHVRGPGVVGETPTLDPGEAFSYTSFCPLPTSLGAMHGSFQMRSRQGDTFDALIDPFVLEDPATIN